MPVRGPVKVTLTRDAERRRVYEVTYLVKAGDKDDGPGQVLLTPGLPVPGGFYQLGNDADLWAFCTFKNKVERWQPKDGEADYWWAVTFEFSTVPTKTCSESQFDDPLLEPARVRGTFVRRTKEATQDRFGNPLVTSSWEQLRGAQVEFYDSTPQIVIEQNVALLNYPLLTSFRNCVNDSVLWGFPPRCVLLSDIQWEQAWYGTCLYYYKRTLTFDVLFETHDRYVLDEGTMALRGKWDKVTTSPTYKEYVLDPDIADDPAKHLNPRNFIKFKDWHGEPRKVLLNGAGRPYDPGVFDGATGTGTGTGADTQVGFRYIQYYNEVNMLLLGIPSIL